jgi:hypothetical protein
MQQPGYAVAACLQRVDDEGRALEVLSDGDGRLGSWQDKCHTLRIAAHLGELYTIMQS